MNSGEYMILTNCNGPEQILKPHNYTLEKQNGEHRVNFFGEKKTR